MNEPTQSRVRLDIESYARSFRDRALAVELFFWLSERFQWLQFDR